MNRDHMAFQDFRSARQAGVKNNKRAKKAGWYAPSGIAANTTDTNFSYW